MRGIKVKFSKAKRREIAEYYVNNNSTIRKTAEHFGIAKSHIHTILVEFQENRETKNSELANAVAELINKNTKERAMRGGLTIKARYEKKD